MKSKLAAIIISSVTFSVTTPAFAQGPKQVLHFGLTEKAVSTINILIYNQKKHLAAINALAQHVTILERNDKIHRALESALQDEVQVLQDKVHKLKGEVRDEEKI